MPGRAEILLHQALSAMQDPSFADIHVELEHHNIFHWRVWLRGLEGTLWQDGMFLLDCHFSRDYDISPPSVKFATIPFHPNIDAADGAVCTSLLDGTASGAWRPGLALPVVFRQIQSLLTHPVSDDPVNLHAAHIWRHTPRLYGQMARDAALASRRIYNATQWTVDPHAFLAQSTNPDGSQPYRAHLVPVRGGGEPAPHRNTAQPAGDPTMGVTHRPSPKARPVSFETYLDEWQAIAASPTVRPDLTLGVPARMAAARSAQPTARRETPMQAKHRRIGALRRLYAPAEAQLVALPTRRVALTGIAADSWNANPTDENSEDGAEDGGDMDGVLQGRGSGQRRALISPSPTVLTPPATLAVASQTPLDGHGQQASNIAKPRASVAIAAPSSVTAPFSLTSVTSLFSAPTLVPTLTPTLAIAPKDDALDDDPDELLQWCAAIPDEADDGNVDLAIM